MTWIERTSASHEYIMCTRTFACNARHEPTQPTIEHVLQAVVLSVLLDLIPETLPKLTAHERVFLLALLEAETHLGQKLLKAVTPIGIPYVELGGDEVGKIHALQR